MTTYYDNNDICAQNLVQKIGNNIVIGVPLGLGKPIGLLNALYKLASSNPSIHLTIITGLTLARPTLGSDLEKRLLAPILDRMLKDFEDPLYEIARVTQTLPSNINVIEFFFSPGKFLNNDYAQQHYINTSYTNVSRDAVNLGMNVLAQLVVPLIEKEGLYSLSCNSDLFDETKNLLQRKYPDKGRFSQPLQSI